MLSEPPPLRLRAAAAGAAERAHDLVADLLRLGVQVEEDACRHALVLAHEAEQDVLGADVVVAETEGLTKRQLEDLLGARREGDLALRRLLAGADDADHGGADLFDGHFETVEDARGHPLLLAEQAEQQVLGADVVVLEGTGLFLREDHDLPGAFGEAFEHAATPSRYGSRSLRRGEETASGACSQSPAYPLSPRRRHDVHLWYPIHRMTRPARGLRCPV